MCIRDRNKAKQYELYPGMTQKFRVSQKDYERKMTDEVKSFREAKKAEYEKYINSDEKQQEKKENEKKLHEEKIKNIDESDTKDIEMLGKIINEKTEDENKNKDIENDEFENMEDLNELIGMEEFQNENEK